MTQSNSYILYGEPGWGSAIIEAQLVWYGLDFEFIRTGDLFASDKARAVLERVNPLRQIPTLLLGDGSVITESAGSDQSGGGPAAGLTAAPGDHGYPQIGVSALSGRLGSGVCEIAGAL